jgi:predicted component of type VI protein secretion system
LKQQKEFQRTTIYLPRELYVKVKLRALLSDTSVSHFMRIALRDKLGKTEENKDVEK